MRKNYSPHTTTIGNYAVMNESANLALATSEELVAELFARFQQGKAPKAKPIPRTLTEHEQSVLEAGRDAVDPAHRARMP